MSALEAKFAREAKPRPTDWAIQHTGGGFFRLVFVGVHGG